MHIRLLLLASAALIVAPVLPSPARAQEAPLPPIVTQGSPEDAAPEAEPDHPSITPELTPESEAPADPPITTAWEPVPVNEEGASAYGLFLSGLVTGYRGDRETAAQLMGEAQALAPEQPRLQEAAFLTSLFAGDLAVAARTAPGPEAPALLSEAGRLVQVVQYWNQGSPSEGWAVVANSPIRAPHDLAGGVLRPWAAAAAGQWDAALPPAGPTAAEVGSLFVRRDRALLMEIAGRPAEAEPIYRALVEQPAGRLLFAQSYGAFLRRQNRRDDAIAVYDAALVAAGAEAPAGLVAAINRSRAETLRRVRPAPLPTLRQGAAIALEAAAASASELERHEVAAVYLRLALSLTPTNALRLSLGQVLIAAEQDKAGRRVLAEISPTAGVDYARAQLAIGQNLAEDESPQAALEAYQNALAQEPGDPMATLSVAIQLAQLERHQEALALLNGPVLNVAEQPFEVHFLRGAAYESLGRLDEAEAELWAALQLRPDDASALNYLGYMWVDSGRRVDQGAEMIARAHAALPDDGNIQDSLGWAQYRMGQFETAVTTLEQAVDKEPGNAVINDHLGDAYWRVGRRREAGFQWTRALSLEPAAELRAAVERKLADGLAGDGVAASEGEARP